MFILRKLNSLNPGFRSTLVNKHYTLVVDPVGKYPGFYSFSYSYTHIKTLGTAFSTSVHLSDISASYCSQIRYKKRYKTARFCTKRAARVAKTSTINNANLCTRSVE